MPKSYFYPVENWKWLLACVCILTRKDLGHLLFANTAPHWNNNGKQCRVVVGEEQRDWIISRIYWFACWPPLSLLHLLSWSHLSYNSRDRDIYVFDLVIKCLELVVRRDKSSLLYMHSIFIALSLCPGCCCNQLRAGSSSPQTSQTTVEKLPVTSLVRTLWGQLKPGGCKLMVKPVAALPCSISLFQPQLQLHYIYLYLQGSVNGRKKPSMDRENKMKSTDPTLPFWWPGN